MKRKRFPPDDPLLEQFLDVGKITLLLRADQRKTGSRFVISTRPRAPRTSWALAMTALVVVEPQSNPTSLIDWVMT